MTNDTIITIDLSYLHTVTGGDKEFEKQLLTGAVNDIETKVNNLKRAWHEQDAKNVKSNAHSLKSLTAIAGIPQIEQWSQLVDQMFSDGTFNSHQTESVYDIIDGWVLAKKTIE